MSDSDTVMSSPAKRTALRDEDKRVTSPSSATSATALSGSHAPLRLQRETALLVTGDGAQLGLEGMDVDVDGFDHGERDGHHLSGHRRELGACQPRQARRGLHVGRIRQTVVEALGADTADPARALIDQALAQTHLGAQVACA
jgi:hypothetical protein